MNRVEIRATTGVASVFALRMLGLFMILPVLALYAADFAEATPIKIGLALGIYGLTQALLQIPFGMASDRLGRKRIIVAGLLIFALGSLIAAWAETIDTIILGRAMQGAGAIAAAGNALLADLTREAERTKAMLVVGITIGGSFMLALVAGPMLEPVLGVPGIFFLTALFALLALPAILWLVPTERARGRAKAPNPILSDLRNVLCDYQLLRLDAGGLILHAALTALFIAVPLSLQSQGLDSGEHWRIYLPVLIASLLGTLPLIYLAERHGYMRKVFVAAVVLLTAALSGLAFAGQSLAFLIGLLLLFFAAFNLLEASLPSLVSKFAPGERRGAAMGMYSSAQFFGAFVGGVLGGQALALWGVEGVFATSAALGLVWLGFAWMLRSPNPAPPETVVSGNPL